MTTLTTDPAAIALATKFAGALVGWLIITYGLILWALATKSDCPITYPAAFITTGAAILLVANGAFVRNPSLGGGLELLGYFVFAAFGTYIFHVEFTRFAERLGDSDADVQIDEHITHR